MIFRDQFDVESFLTLAIVLIIEVGVMTLWTWLENRRNKK